MQIAQVLANYTLGSADILRKAMGKKDEKEMSNNDLILSTVPSRTGLIRIYQVRFLILWRLSRSMV